MNWNEYIEFVENITKKNYLTELDSIENWKKSKDSPDHIYENKLLAIYLLLINIETVLEKFSSKLTEYVNYAVTLAHRIS